MQEGVLNHLVLSLPYPSVEISGSKTENVRRPNDINITTTLSHSLAARHHTIQKRVRLLRSFSSFSSIS